MLLRTILFFIAVIHCLAFVPPQRLIPVHGDAVLSPIAKKHDVCGVYGIGISLSSRMHASKTIFNAQYPDDSDENDEINYTNDDLNEIELSTIRMGSSTGVGEYNREEKLGLERETANVGDPQLVLDEPMNITDVLTELQAIQSQGPKKYCILGTRHCSFLHQQIVEMLAYALVLSGNHLYTSGAAGTNAAAIRGALRAFQPQLLTVVLPQSMSRQTPESQELLQDVTNVITMPQNDELPLDVASRICNSQMLSETDHLISFAFHESKTVLEAAQEAQKLDMLVTLLYLD